MLSTLPSRDKYKTARLVLDEARPWDLAQALTRLELELDFTGPEEEGLSRVERRERLMMEAA